MTTNDETQSTPEKSGENQDPGGAPAAADPIVAVTAERDQLRDQLLRTAADFDNYRKRTRREIDDAKARGRDDAVKDILPVFDNLERAVAAADSAQTVASVVEGVKMVLKLFEDTAERMGLVRVKTTGERFDPALHDALGRDAADTPEADGAVTAVLEKGWKVGDTVIRPARVRVGHFANEK